MGACRNLTMLEVRALSQACRGRNGLRDRTLILMGVCTGFRVSELLSLRRKDVIDYRGEIPTNLFVDRKAMKKKVAGRAVPLIGEVRELLREWLGELWKVGFPLETDPLFPNRITRKSIGRTAAWKMIRRRAMAARMDVRLLGTHSWRKTLAVTTETRCPNGENPIMLVKAVLGHKSIESTQAYLATVKRGNVAAAFEDIGSMVFKNTNEASP